MDDPILIGVLLFVLVACLMVGPSSLRDQSGGASIASYDFPVNRQEMRSYWGPYLWGQKPRPFYQYGPTTAVPYPYGFECDQYANQVCQEMPECNPMCYQEHYTKCSAGLALVDPEVKVGKC